MESGRGKCAFYAGLPGLQAHLDNDEVCWNRIGDAELVPAGAGKTMVAWHPRARIYSRRPTGLGRDDLKWEIPA